MNYDDDDDDDDDDVSQISRSTEAQRASQTWCMLRYLIQFHYWLLN